MFFKQESSTVFASLGLAACRHSNKIKLKVVRVLLYIKKKNPNLLIEDLIGFLMT